LSTLHWRDSRRAPRLAAAAAAGALSALTLLPFAWQGARRVAVPAPAPQSAVAWLSLPAMAVSAPRSPSTAPEGRGPATAPARAGLRDAWAPASASTSPGAAPFADASPAVTAPAVDAAPAAALPAAPVPAPPASAPLDLGSQVIRQAARASKSQVHVLAESSGAYTGDAALSKEQQLARDIQDTAKPDCLTPGGHLLSIFVIAYQVARDKCK
jgi:hypothetical protein